MNLHDAGEVLASFETAGLKERANALAWQIPKAEQVVQAHKLELARVLDAQKLREDELLIEGGVEGKNAEERAASLNVLKRKDQTWGRMQEQKRRLEDALVAAEGEAERMRREARAVSMELSLATAQVSFLASALGGERVPELVTNGRS